MLPITASATADLQRLGEKSQVAFLYYLAVPDPVAAASLAACRAIVSAEELARSEAFVLARHRSQRLLARALVRRVLSNLTGAEPASWRFRQNDYGRPEIEVPWAYRALKFSLSHTNGLLACLAAWDRQVGVDVEPLRPVASLLEVAEAQFANCETAALRNLASDAQNSAFLELWTLKEAYLKARGLGLSAGLSRVAFRVKQDAGYQISAGFDPELADDPAQWQFELRALGGNVVATAIERRPGLSVDIVVRNADALMQQAVAS
jgi:4'-phosphopantetheinyl transferase